MNSSLCNESTFIENESTSVINYTHSRSLLMHTSLTVILIGLVGNLMVILLLSQKNIRSNPSHVYLFCSTLVDSFFLIIHLFEDTIRMLKEVYAIKNNLFLNFLTMTDTNIIACKLVNFLRYSLRFMSSYVVISFMIQRLYVVSQPFNSRSLTTKSVWKTISLIGLASFILNLWTLFLFHLILNENNQIYCDVNSEYMFEYIISSSTYICFTILIPSIIIFVCNTLVIFKATKHKTLRNELTNRSVRKKQMDSIRRIQAPKSVDQKSATKEITTDSDEIRIEDSSAERFTLKKKRLKPHYWTKDQIMRRQNNKKFSSFQNLTITLLLVSFSFVALNLPNFLLWLVYFYHTTFLNVDGVEADRLFENFKFSEIFYLMSYGTKFFIFTATGTLFRNIRCTKKSKDFIRSRQVTYYRETYIVHQ